MNKSISYEALSLLDTVGYQVAAATCDVENRAVWEELEITERNHHFPHPKIKNAVVYAFADIPQLLKLLRNWFFDNGFVVSGSNEKFSGAILQNIADHHHATADICVLHRLTQLVIDARDTFPHAVWPAARIWSHSMAKAVKSAGKQRLLNITEYQEPSDFILTVNDWFDVHNSEMQFGKHQGLNAYGIDLKNQDRTLLLMSTFMQNTRIGARTTSMPFQKDIMISNAALRGLHNFLEEEFPKDYKYLITRRLRRDVLENFFSHIRNMDDSGDQPSGYGF